ncbi:MAG: ATP-binding cassette domain-containing protein [Gammaproteobacteria bacterium]|nr:ATP-binding cassette domain-containing protein [Gammaproteobacteria bacterium]
MTCLRLDQAALAFGHVPLLDQADFQLEEGERVGLIGRNGTGKSSLLRVLAGVTQLDDGRMWRKDGLTLCYVSQEPELDSESSVFEAVAQGLAGLNTLLSEYHALTQRMADPDADHDGLLKAMQTLQAKLEAADGWTASNRIDTVIARLGLEADVKVGALSGGLRKRVALAVALVQEPDVLILDEPTNHLDFSSIEWLEGLLKGFNGAVLLVTHDRRFLDNVVTRIVELDRGRLQSFPGNFTDYQRLKAAMLESEAVERAKFDKFLAQEEAWIRQGIKARRTRNEGRVRRLEALRREHAVRRDRTGSVDMQVDAGERSGRLVAELEHVTKSFGDRVVIRDFSCQIRRGDKVGVLGPNGAGKSTLLKIILGELRPDSGTVRQGTRLEVAYFDQMRAQLDDNATLVETVSPGGDFVEIGGRKRHVIGYLGDFLFAPERARSPVKSCSGGERNRLLLARLFTQPANVLVLDEPTNDLDIETLELLEDLLVEYEGTLFLVSHDRTFLDNVVTQVIAFEHDGTLREYVGGYEDWQRQKAAVGARDVPQKRPPEKEAKPAKAAPAKSGVKRLDYMAQRELDALPEQIEALETEQKEIVEVLGAGTLYRDDPERAKALQLRADEIEETLIRLIDRWEELERRREG